MLSNSAGRCCQDLPLFVSTFAASLALMTRLPCSSRSNGTEEFTFTLRPPLSLVNVSIAAFRASSKVPSMSSADSPAGITMFVLNSPSGLKRVSASMREGYWRVPTGVVTFWFDRFTRRLSVGVPLL